MKLRLNVITHRSQPTNMPMGTVFDAEGGTIGRASGNAWVLPDPERFISGTHAQITLQNGQYYLTDISTNGTYVNANPQPLGKGNRVPLTNGDRIIIGDYVIEVVLEELQTADAIPRDQEEDFFNPTTPDLPAADEDDIFGFSEQDDANGGIDTGPTNSDFPAPDTPIGASEPDHVAAENQFFQPPQSIPEDWDLMEEDIGAPSEFTHSQLTVPLPEPASTTLTQPIPTPRAVPSNDLDALNKLLEGAGINPLDIPADEATETLRMLGSLMREMVGGVMEILRARAEIKSEFRMQLTTIRPVENNPLKFTVNVDDAMQHLLASANGAYLPPLESVRQAIEDIQAHQMAVMAGMQAALTAMLQKFEPSALEEYFARKGGRSILESKKAWYWEQYGEKHKELLMEAEDNFQDFFGEEFARAYESQITKLAQARKNR